MRYGLPYQGSKNGIAEWVINRLPPADCFVDLFGGGGAITHAALLHGRYSKFIYNEFNPLIVKSFKMAIYGEFKNENRWISREDFERLKTTDPYVTLCFSFSNAGINYCYAKELEPWKKALHYARFFGDLSEFQKMGIPTDGSRKDIESHKDEYKALYIKWYMKNVMLSDMDYQIKKEELEKNIKEESERLRAYLIKARDEAGVKSSDVDKYLGTNGMAGHYFGRSQWEFPTRENYIKMQEIMPTLDRNFNEVVGLSTLWQSLQRLKRLESLESLESLGRLESLESLQSLERLESLEIYNKDYQAVPIPSNSVIYCDPPYFNTFCGMYDGFDHERFWNWARKQNNIFISEYSMPEDFIPIAQIEKIRGCATNNSARAIEKIWTNQQTFEALSNSCKAIASNEFAEQLTFEF